MRWQKEKDPLAPGRAEKLPKAIPFLGLAAALLTLFSFLLWDEDALGGDVSRAVSYFEEFFSENEAIAVFLGWEGK